MLKVDIKKSLGSFVLETKFECEDVFAILGASGSGKTMTLKCIAGVEKPDEGRIELDGRVLFDSKEHIAVIENCSSGRIVMQEPVFSSFTSILLRIM